MRAGYARLTLQHLKFKGTTDGARAHKHKPGAGLDIFKSLRLKGIANTAYKRLSHKRWVHMQTLAFWAHTTDKPNRKEKIHAKETRPKIRQQKNVNRKRGKTKDDYNNNENGSCIGRGKRLRTRTEKRNEQQQPTFLAKNQRHKHYYQCDNLISFAYRREKPSSEWILLMFIPQTAPDKISFAQHGAFI